MRNIKVASFFAGVGGIDLGFMKAGKKIEVVYANEIDKFAVKVYETNMKLKVDCRDIRKVKSDEIPDFDILVGGFPCQAFSTEGKLLGFNDERGLLIYEILRILKDKKPRAFLLENVKNLVAHNGGQTFQIIMNELKKLNYKVTYKVMNTKDYGNIPQNRARIYIVGFKDKRNYKKFEFPQKVELTRKIEELINFSERVDDKYYYEPGKYKAGLFEKLNNKINYDKHIIWRYKFGRVEYMKNNISFCLLASSGGGHKAFLIRDYSGKIRKLTPREYFNLQGFDAEYKLPQDVSDYQLYKEAGNSVTVEVIRRIAEKMIRCLR